LTVDSLGQKEIGQHEMVARERLTDRLRFADTEAVLLHAPAGYGKSVLLSQWGRMDPRPFAWVTLTGAHDDPGVLLTAIAEAFAPIEPIEAAVIDSIQTSRPNLDVVVPRLERALRERVVPAVLVLDEPTVFLPEEEVDRLFDLIRTVVAEGAAVLFISHDLAAVRIITDRVVVLRDGRVVAEEATAEIREDELVDLIVGAPARPGENVPAPAAPVQDQRAVALTLAAMESVGDGIAVAAGENVAVEHLTDERLHDLSFEIGAGEILGVAGLIGSGAEELPYLLFGARPAGSGTLRLGAETLDVAGLSPQRSVRERVALVPADRAVQGLSQSLTLWENIVMLVESEHYRSGVFHRAELVTLAREAIDRFLIRPPLAHNAVSTFSGGNQQKALLAKWLLARPRLMLLHEPTQGVDVGARRDIYRFVKSAAALDHMAVLWVTTDFGELAEVCDRVIVITQGRQTAVLAGEELSEEAISAAALRQTREVIP